MYRRPKFVEKLLEIREEMAHEADFDVVLFVERVRNGEVGTNARPLKRMSNSPRERRAAAFPACEPEPTSRG